MANNDCTNVHAGHGNDLKRLLAFYESIPSLFYSPKKLNKLIYLEEYADREMAILRFEEMSCAPLREKLALAKSVNPNLIELIPGENFELT
jgi:hypothetical protein